MPRCVLLMGFARISVVLVLSFHQEDFVPVFVDVKWEFFTKKRSKMIIHSDLTRPGPAKGSSHLSGKSRLVKVPPGMLPPRFPVGKWVASSFLESHWAVKNLMSSWWYTGIPEYKKTLEVTPFLIGWIRKENDNFLIVRPYKIQPPFENGNGGSTSMSYAFRFGDEGHLSHLLMFDDWIPREGLSSSEFASSIRGTWCHVSETWWLVFSGTTGSTMTQGKMAEFGGAKLAVSKLVGGFKFQIFLMFYPYLGKWSHLTNMFIIFSMAWNHQNKQILPKILRRKNPHKQRWNVLEIFVPLGFLDQSSAGGFCWAGKPSRMGKLIFPKINAFKKFLERRGQDFLINV